MRPCFIPDITFAFQLATIYNSTVWVLVRQMNYGDQQVRGSVGNENFPQPRQLEHCMRFPYFG